MASGGGGGLNDITVSVGGDISPLQDALSKIPEAAAGVSTSLENAFAGLDVLPKVEADLAGVSDAMKKTAADSKIVDDAMQKLADAAKNGGDAARQASSGWMDLSPAIKDTGNAADQAGLSLTDLLQRTIAVTLTFGAMKAAAEEMVTAFGNLQSAKIALTAIEGSAKDAGAAIETMQHLADQLGQSQSGLIAFQQRLAVYNIDLQAMPGIMNAVASSAVSMNTNFDTSAQRFTQIIESGRIMSRTLVSLGLDMNDIAEAMRQYGAKVGDSEKEIKAAFLSIGDESERATVLATASFNKLGDVAQQTAEGVKGSWNQIKNATLSAFQDMGQAVDGFKGLAAGAGIAIKFLADVFIEFVGAVKVGADFSIAMLQTLSTSFVALRKVAVDALSGDWAKAAADLASADFGGAAEQIKNSWNYAMQQVKKDTSDTTTTLDKLWSDTSGKIDTSIKPIVLHLNDAGDAMKKLAKEIEALDKSAETLLNHIPATFGAYLDTLAEGGRTAKSMLASVETELNKFYDLMKRMDGATTPMLVEFGKLKQAQAILEGFAASEAFAKSALAIEAFATKYSQQIGKLDSATLDWVNTMTNAAHDVPEALNKMTDVQVLTKWAESVKALDASTAKWNETLHKTEMAANKIGVQMEEINSPINADLEEFADKTRGWVKLLFDAVTVAGTQLAVMESMKSAGIALTSQMQSNLAVLERTLVLMQQTHKSYVDQLQMEALIYEKHIALNVALAASGAATLDWTIKLEAVKIQQAAILDQTMGLSKLYTGMVKEFGAAWNAAGKGIADAIVSGQNFGQVFTSVIDTLKKQLSELVVNYLMTQLKDAILTNTNLLGNFSTVFAGIFGGDGSGGLVAKGIGELDKAVATSAVGIGNAATAASASITSTTQTAATGLTTIASTMASTILPMITAIASVIGAITGIIGNIEMAHMEKTLGQIETNTRQAFNALGAGSDSIAGTSKLSSQKLGSILETIQGTVITLLIQINADLDDILTTLKAGLMVGEGGSGGGASTSALSEIIKALQGQIAVLTTQVNGAYGIPGSATSSGTSAPSGSAAVNYAGMSAVVTPVAVPLTLTESLLISIAKNVADILIALADHFKTSVSLLTSEAVASVMSGFLDLPLDLIAKATQAAAAAAQNAALATTGVTSATTGLTTATIATGATNAMLQAAVIPVLAAVAQVMGTNSAILTALHPASVPTQNYTLTPGGSNTMAGDGGYKPGYSPYVGSGPQHGPASVNLNVNVTGGGVQIAKEIVSALQGMGVRVT